MVCVFRVALPLFLSVALAVGGASAAPQARLVDEYWRGHNEQSAAIVDHSPWAAFLSAYLVAGADGINRVRYGAVTDSDRAALDAYVAMLEDTPITELRRSEQMALWINLYNAVTVKAVLGAYPVDSIRNVKGGLFSTGPWDEHLATVSGRKLSLNDIEHGILRPIWQDPRIHYAVNCASLGCPNLVREPYGGPKIDVMLTEAAYAYVNDPRGVRIEGDALVASRLYDWYETDFGGDQTGVIGHLKTYALPVLKAKLDGFEKIGSYSYDWALNDAP